MSSCVGTEMEVLVLGAGPALLGLGLEDGRGRLLGLVLNGGFEALGFGRQLVVLCGQQVVEIADLLEEDVEARLPLDGPEDTAVLEPRVGEYTMKSAEDVDQVLDPDVLAMIVAEYDEAAREYLLVRDHVGGPIERVAAVVDGAAALGLLVHGAQELPLGGAHLGTGVGATRGGVEEEADDEGVALRDEEAAELVEPDGTVDAGRGLGELVGGGAGERLGVGRGVVAVQGGEVFLKLKGRVQL